MGSLDKLCLRWNDFGGNVSRSFATIRANNKFFDCTLTTDDDDTYSDYLRAHKVILAASSELFRKILDKESLCTNPNPVVYLKGISAKDLKLILDFIYEGEVNVVKEELDSFLEAAETLKVHGLTSSARHIKKPNVAMVPPPLATKQEPIPSLQSETNQEAASDYQHKIGNNTKSALNEDHFITEALCGAKYDAEDHVNENLSSHHSEEAVDGVDTETDEDFRGEHEGDLNERKRRKRFKHLTGTEKITLVNIIKTLDPDRLLINAKGGGKSKGEGGQLYQLTTERRRAIWQRILTTLNNICGTNYSFKKVQQTFLRWKATPDSKYYALLNDDPVDSEFNPIKKARLETDNIENRNECDEDKIGDKKQSAMIDQDHMGDLCDAYDDVKDVTDENLSSHSSDVVGDSEDIELDEDHFERQVGEINDGTQSNHYKHLTGSEKITLINLIKTLDPERLLINAKEKDSYTSERRRAVWHQILASLNKICGTNYDLRKLKNTCFGG